MKESKIMIPETAVNYADILAGGSHHAPAPGESSPDLEIVPFGDFVKWYCGWCDSENLTFWAKVDQDRFLVCGACHRKFEIPCQSGSCSK